MTMTISGASASPGAARSTSPNRLARVMSDLLATSSLEMSAHRPGDAAAIAALLPRGTSVLVNHLPRHDLADTLRALIAVRAAGLEPVPHLAARRVASRKAAQDFLARAVGEAGVRRLLLLGGDAPDQTGPYADAAALLSDGLIVESGIREVAFAAYPEGHPRIPSSILTRALDTKIARAGAFGLGVSVITQFSFAPQRIIELAADLNRRAPHVPVHVGIPGPVSPRTLLRFAQVCGVSASLRAMTAAGMGAVRLVTHTDPGEQLTAIARHTVDAPGSNIVGVHLFTFGGVEAAARWINAKLTGAG